MLEAVEAGERTPSEIEVLNLQALAYQARGEPAQAMAALERALALAEPEGYVRIPAIQEDETNPLNHPFVG